MHFLRHGNNPHLVAYAYGLPDLIVQLLANPPVVEAA